MQFAPFVSDIEISFYSSLASLKLDHDKLDDSTRRILGLYEIRPSDPPETSCRIQIRGNALVTDHVPPGFLKAEGLMKNFNTADEYKSADKAALLQDCGKRIWDAIRDGSIYSNPSILASFLMLSFADLKRFRFSYWFAFPAIHSDPPWRSIDTHGPGSDTFGWGTAAQAASQLISSSDRDRLVDAVQAWQCKVDPCQHGFFLAKRTWIGGSRSVLNSALPDDVLGDISGEFAKQPSQASWDVSSLSSYERGFFQNTPEEDCFVCFVDPSNYADGPGWMLRNLLTLVRQRWKLSKVQIIRYRDIPSQAGEVRSISMYLYSEPEGRNANVFVANSSTTMPKISGWERNIYGRLSGRTVNLTEHMDPQRIADQSVDLNLKLMKWRISPTLNLEAIKNTKCLLLGAGTLGCYVARNLLGWGVRTITFVDNGSVSFSNPVRQPLFDFQDCLNGGAKKAIRAAEALREIYPGVCSTGHVLSVPMVGHQMINEEDMKKNYETLKGLIEDHDAIFLLMDSRESRWLPTVMGKAANKIVMNAALGFDTFVVMRHGTTVSKDSDLNLGCYFCNDVVAPANSSKVQTLDQQCTVTRPGVAATASALLVELFVSILQHPRRASASGSSQEEDGSSHPLGIVPHQIRGFLSTFSNVVVTGQSYEFCSACSPSIIRCYLANEWIFVRRAINESGYIEQVSGLEEVQRLAEEAMASLDFEDNLSSESDTDLI